MLLHILTIVAACGADSWNGLAGVAPDSRQVDQPSLIIGDMEIGLAVPEFWTSVMHSPWASRGWTFQERLFSKRMLIFAEKQCFFYCDKVTRFESTITEVDTEEGSMEYRFLYPHLWVDDRKKLLPAKNELASRVLASKNSLLDYFQIFCNHRCLTLTYPADVLRALGGVIATYEQQLSSASYFGIPTSLFTYALLLDRTQCNRRPGFPSWSWAGWFADREDLLYTALVCSAFSGAYYFNTLTVFYRLHPTLNSKSRQDQWILTAIDDRDTRGAAEARRELRPVLFDQHLPEHLTRQDLEQLLVFDAPASEVKISPEDPSYFQSSLCPPDLEGEEFDRDHNMTFARLANHSVIAPPYLPRNQFPKDSSKLLELILIASGFRTSNRDSLVWLMVVETDEQGVSTKLSFCVLTENAWLTLNPKRRRVYLI